MPNPHGDFRFVLEFDSIAEFATFVAIIRGIDFGDDAKLQEMTARLKKSTKALSDAERASENADAA
jgi:hypothetical protein